MCTHAACGEWVQRKATSNTPARAWLYSCRRVILVTLACRGFLEQFATQVKH